jgi:hypothetical protein
LTSDAQRRANRANAQHSTGPKSEHGKALTRLNAEKHGIASAPALTTEREAELTALASRLFPNPAPRTVQALEASDAIAAMKRIREFKQHLLDACIAEIPPTASPSEREAIAVEAFSHLAQTWRSLGDYDRRHASRLRKALKSLR